MVQKDDLLHSFPYPMITTIRGSKPTYETIRELQQKLSENTVSVQSNLGGGQHRYSSLTVKPVVYFNLTGNVFNPPTDLGPISNIVQGMDAAQTAMLEKQHTRLQRARTVALEFGQRTLSIFAMWFPGGDLCLRCPLRWRSGQVWTNCARIVS